MRRPLLLAAAVVLALAAGAIWHLLGAEGKPHETASIHNESASTRVVEHPSSAGSADVLPPTAAAQNRPAFGTIAGAVVTSEGAAAAGAQVSLEVQPVPGITQLPGGRTLTADAAGHFRIDHVSPGIYALVAQFEGLVSDRMNGVAVGPGASVEGLQLVLAPGATLVGTVRDAADGSSIDGCRVQFGARTLPCERAGRFQVGPLAPGGVQLRVSADGYAPQDVAVELTRRARLTAEVLLSRGATLSGVVLDPDHKPFAGARVRSAHYTVEKTPVAEVSAITDAEGRFTLDGVGEGRVSARASADGFAEATSEELVLVPGERKDGLTLQLSTGGAIAGSVVQPQGAPVAGAEVHALRLSDRELVARDVSSDDGSFRLDGLVPGDYTVVAQTAQARGLASGVKVTAREESQVSVVLGADRITGKVVDAQGAAVAGALVSAVSAYGSGLGAQTATSDKEGRFALEGLVGSPFRVQAQAAQKGSVEVRGVTAGSEVELKLEDTGRLEGTVTDGRGQGLTDFELALLPSDPARTSGVGHGFRTQHLLSPDGSFRIDQLPAGHYRVRAKAPRLVEAETEVEVPAGSAATVKLQLQAGGTVRGRVLQGEEPAAGCRLDPGAWPVTSDAQGHFELVGVPVGRVAVWASCPDGRWGGTRVDVADGETREVTVPLHAAEEGRHEQPSDFGGIGAGLRQRGDGQVVITFVSEGGPAFLAGLQAGDEVVAVDGWAAQGQALTEVIRRVRGPVGTPVRLGMRREATGAAWEAFPERVRITLD